MNFRHCLTGYKIAALSAGSIKGEAKTRLLLALLLPWLQFFTIGRPIAGIICLILQITVIGWIPAAIWSVYALSQYNTDRKIEEATR